MNVSLWEHMDIDPSPKYSSTLVASSGWLFGMKPHLTRNPLETSPSDPPWTILPPCLVVDNTHASLIPTALLSLSSPCCAPFLRPCYRGHELPNVRFFNWRGPPEGAEHGGGGLGNPLGDLLGADLAEGAAYMNRLPGGKEPQEANWGDHAMSGIAPTRELSPGGT